MKYMLAALYSHCSRSVVWEGPPLGRNRVPT